MKVDFTVILLGGLTISVHGINAPRIIIRLGSGKLGCFIQVPTSGQWFGHEKSRNRNRQKYLDDGFAGVCEWVAEVECR